MVEQIITHLVDVCHRLYVRGMVTATDGNVSVRLPSGNILTTRSGINKGMVSENDFVEITIEASMSAEAGNLRRRSGCTFSYISSGLMFMRLLHAHPTYATGFATARIALDECTFPEVIVGIGAIPLAKYATPSTPEVAASLAPFITTSDAILLANHGAVTCGTDVYDAYYKMEKVEHAAHITFVAKMLGGSHSLNEKELANLRSVSVQSYGKDVSGKIACDIPAETADDLSESALREYVVQTLQRLGVA